MPRKKDGASRIGRRMLLAFRLLFPLCLIATVVFIFSNSADMGEVSSGKSLIVTELLNKCMTKIGISYTFTEYLVRKLAHFLEYTLLGFWLMLTLCVYTRRILSFLAWPLFFGLLTAVCDEFLQLYTPGRAGQVRDVMIDFGGVTAGLITGLIALLLSAAIWDARHGRR